MTMFLSDPRVAMTPVHHADEPTLVLNPRSARRLLLAGDRLSDCAELDALAGRFVASVTTTRQVA